MKTVNVVGHAFDCLPGHVTISARGSGGTVRIATMRAVSAMFDDQRLRRKQIGDFKISGVVISDKRTSDKRTEDEKATERRWSGEKP